MKITVLFGACLCFVHAVHVVSSSKILRLNDENFLEETEGKSVFILFFTPWCDKCKNISPDWEKLAEEWAGHAMGVIGEVDCTDKASELLCDDYQVSSYPTLYWGDPQSPEEYLGETDYQSLSQFAKAHISTPVCSVRQPHYCDDAQIALIHDLMSKSTAELEEMEADIEGRVQEHQKAFDEALLELNAQYEVMVNDYNTKVDALRSDSKYKWVQQAIVQKKLEEDAKDEL